MQRLALFADDQICGEDLPAEFHNGHALDDVVRACSRCLVEQSLSYNGVLTCLETNLLRQALAGTGGNRTKAAKRLGLSLSTLRDKLKKYGLDASAEPS